MAHSYGALYNLPMTGLRFLRLWLMGRPDQALLFLQKIYLKIKK